MTAPLSIPPASADIEIGLIDVPAGRRKLSADWVETLADLFGEQGQQVAIEVVAADGRFRLIYGGHRLAAAKRLGWSRIGAVVKKPEDFASAAEIKLREITENLARRQLSVLDKAVDIASWREAYEAANGAVTRGRKKLSQVATNTEDQAEAFAASFSEAARKALGVNRDAVSRAMRIAGIAAQVRDQIALHPIADNQSELLLLAVEPVERQEQIADLLTSGPVPLSTVTEAIALIDRLPKPARLESWERLSDAFSRMKDRDQDRFFALHEVAIRRWIAGQDEI